MTDQDLQTQLAQLRALYDQGLLSEANYRAALAGLGVDPATVFAQQRQQVETQINVAGDILIADPDRLWRAIRRRPPTQDLRRSTARYLTYVVDRYRYLDLKGMGVSDRVPLRLPLAEMYVPLKARVELPEGETWSRSIRLAGREMLDVKEAALGERLSAPRPVLDLLRRNSGLIVLGDPGAGKTTFLKHLALGLATGQGESLNLDVHLPVLVPLSAYANALAQREVRLDDFIADYFHNLGTDLPIGAMLREALAQGGALVLLDGLDEVQDSALRGTVVERVVDFYTFHRRAGNKFALTSRVVGYREVRPTVEGLAECTLVDFEDEEIETFAAQWTAAIERAAHGDTPVAAGEAAREKGELLAAIHNNPGVRRLAANPLLLTILALMKRQGVTLPERRVELYDQYVRTLLSSWNRARGLGRPPARDLDVVETVRILAPLALWMHQVNPGVGLVKEGDLRRKLVEIYRQGGEADPERASRRFLADVREHASLLLERGAGQYGFIHLTFEEYLAAVGVARLGQRDIAPVVELLARHVGDPAWREVALLTVGYLGIVQQQEQVAGDVVAALLEREPGEPGQAITLAGQAVVDAWPGGVTLACKDQVVQALTQTLGDDGRIAAPLRAATGAALARLGDPRREVLVPEAMTFCRVPAGPFLMGTSEKDVPALREQFGADEFYKYEWETPLRQVQLPAYYVARYPVTNAQYRAFVEGGGYQVRRYWREAHAAGRWRDGKLIAVQFRFEEGGWRSYEVEADAPQDFDEPFNLPNHPVVGVAWYEALAFARWLTQTWQEKETLPAGWTVRLPTEAEWEKAARGGLEIPATPAFISLTAEWDPTTTSNSNPQPRRHFPWGDDPDPNRANYYDTGIGVTNAVGCFPGGASPYGAEELSGNVWEWTQSLWGEDWGKPDFKYPYDPNDGRENLEAGEDVLRVLRGGSFAFARDGVRCASRVGDFPSVRVDFIGFRVVVSPISPPSAL
jgi:formylglycine-generating enzyme required for sulfatase activity